jgi:hypothetical protein
MCAGLFAHRAKRHCFHGRGLFNGRGVGPKFTAILLFANARTTGPIGVRLPSGCVGVKMLVDFARPVGNSRLAVFIGQCFTVVRTFGTIDAGVFLDRPHGGGVFTPATILTGDQCYCPRPATVCARRAILATGSGIRCFVGVVLALPARETRVGTLCGQRIVFAVSTRLTRRCCWSNTMPNQRRPTTGQTWFTRFQRRLFDLVAVCPRNASGTTVGGRCLMFLIGARRTCLAGTSETRGRHPSRALDTIGTTQYFSGVAGCANIRAVRGAINP